MAFMRALTASGGSGQTLYNDAISTTYNVWSDTNIPVPQNGVVMLGIVYNNTATQIYSINNGTATDEWYTAGFQNKLLIDISGATVKIKQVWAEGQTTVRVYIYG